MNKNKILMLFVAILACLTGSVVAHAENHYLILDMNSGERASFALAQKPVVSVGGQLLIFKGAEATIEVAMSEVTDYHFGESAGIEEVSDNQADATMGMENGDAVIRNLKAGTAVRVYGIDGTLRLQTVASADGVASIQLSDLAGGVYVIQTPSGSFKIYKR